MDEKQQKIKEIEYTRINFLNKLNVLKNEKNRLAKEINKKLDSIKISKILADIKK